MSVISLHPASKLTCAALMGMMIEEFPEADSVVMCIINKEGTAECFSTRIKSSDLAFHKWCLDNYIDQRIGGREEE